MLKAYTNYATASLISAKYRTACTCVNLYANIFIMEILVEAIT